jgi:leucyl/phenylalanyl-tRNA--protein transferase
MFTRVPDASKTALAALCAHLEQNRFDFIDCQVTTDHLVSMGAVEVSRKVFLAMLTSALKHGDLPGPWRFKGLPGSP